MRSWKRYAAALVINVVVTLVVLCVRGFELKVYYVDAFSAAGGVSILLGLLMWVADAGAYDTIGYGFSVFGAPKKYKDLYEYTLKKKEKRSRQKGHFLPFVIVGLVFLGGSFLTAAIG